MQKQLNLQSIYRHKRVQLCDCYVYMFTLYTVHDCTPRHQENTILKYVDDNTIIGHIIKK